jgi:hypothetical protein
MSATAVVGRWSAVRRGGGQTGRHHGQPQEAGARTGGEGHDGGGGGREAREDGDRDEARDQGPSTVDDSAEVVCGNVRTANANVYIIDTVLMPKS